MAEKLVSPGVFTKENDLSFLQQGIADIGAAFVGPFLEGPAVPTIVNSQSEFETLFGKADGTYYTPLAVQNYLREAGTATICRVVGVGGYTETAPMLIHRYPSGSNSAETASAIIFGTLLNDNGGFTGATAINDGNFMGTAAISTSFATVTASLNSSNVNNLEAVFGTSPFGSKDGYVYASFKNATISSGSEMDIHVLADQEFNFDAQEAITPIVTSQKISEQRYGLFEFETIAVGNAANTKVKVSISNIKAAGSVAGTDYGTFNVVVRAFNDTDKKKNVLETFANVNLDPNSPNFISRVIGDRKVSFKSDGSGKVIESGDWVNNSKYIRVKAVNLNAPVQAVPFGHAKYHLPIATNQTISNTIPAVTYSTGSSAQSSSVYFAGIDLENTDNLSYLKPIPNNALLHKGSAFGLDNSEQNSLSVGNPYAQFTLAFQHGFDGMAPTVEIYKDSNINNGNTQGFDLTNATSSGSVAYMRHINALSNADEFDINMIVAPGVTKNDHSYVHQAIVDMVEQRGDAFFITEMGDSDLSLSATVTKAGELDSNYAATYYPWVKTIDINTNKLITVPPSVLLPGVFAANDRIAAEWFAPAGLNRGGLVGAISVLDKVTQAERDELYEGKVNPICQFPGQGIVVWGQKTLQDKPSALDRINVRRLLLTVRKYIASTSKFLVFEQNSSETRNRFLNIVNPYLEGIQQRQGLYAFRVVMDETNNTPDVIDRNILKGAIYLQPTKTAEFIQIDFNILPTGASFAG